MKSVEQYLLEKFLTARVEEINVIEDAFQHQDDKAMVRQAGYVKHKIADFRNLLYELRRRTFKGIDLDRFNGGHDD